MLIPKVALRISLVLTDDFSLLIHGRASCKVERCTVLDGSSRTTWHILLLPCRSCMGLFTLPSWQWLILSMFIRASKLGDPAFHEQGPLVIQLGGEQVSC